MKSVFEYWSWDDAMMVAHELRQKDGVKRRVHWSGTRYGWSVRRVNA